MWKVILTAALLVGKIYYLFNAYFHSVFVPPDMSDIDSLQIPNYGVDSELMGFVVSNESVLNELKSLDVTKASLGISLKLLRACADEIAPSLCELFNMSLHLGQFPEKWKDVNLVPIYKSEAKSQVLNYRGISLLDVLSKLLEKQVFHHTYDFVSPHLTEWQHGFLPGKSTVTQLTQVVHHFSLALENKQQVDVIYLDFSKAFDRVPHERLLIKLECLGIKGSLLSWFRSYLTGRRHRVIINGEKSTFLPVMSGVPQGSILGPLLFLIFINDMPSSISQGTSLPLFADDSKCFRLILGQDDGIKLQNDLTNLCKWASTWGMEFNVKKCKVLRIARIKSIFERDYYLGNMKLERVEVEKDLGVLITHNLSWNNHVDYTTAKAQKMLNVLYRSCKDISDSSIKKLLYITWVRSRLEYASVVWSPHTKRNIIALERIQRRATRFIVGRELSYPERLNHLHLLPLTYRREICDIIFLFKCLRGLCHVDISNYVTFRSCDKPLRNIDYLTLKIPFSRTEAFKNSYFVRVCRLWNILSLHIRESESLLGFRRKLINFYFDKFLSNISLFE